MDCLTAAYCAAKSLCFQFFRLAIYKIDNINRYCLNLARTSREQLQVAVIMN